MDGWMANFFFFFLGLMVCEMTLLRSLRRQSLLSCVFLVVITCMFSGGCFVLVRAAFLMYRREGLSVAKRWIWNQTIGPTVERPGRDGNVSVCLVLL